jgi:hypothetical protein
MAIRLGTSPRAAQRNARHREAWSSSKEARADWADNPEEMGQERALGYSGEKLHISDPSGAALANVVILSQRKSPRAADDGNGRN